MLSSQNELFKNEIIMTKGAASQLLPTIYKRERKPKDLCVLCIFHKTVIHFTQKFQTQSTHVKV